MSRFEIHSQTKFHQLLPVIDDDLVSVSDDWLRPAGGFRCGAVATECHEQVTCEAT